MPSVTVYATATCPYCMRARNLLEKKGVSFDEIRVDVEPDRWQEMEERSGRNTVPQIFIDDFHVGGFDDMVELDFDGELDERLGISEA